MDPDIRSAVTDAVRDRYDGKVVSVHEIDKIVDFLANLLRGHPRIQDLYSGEGSLWQRLLPFRYK